MFETFGFEVWKSCKPLNESIVVLGLEFEKCYVGGTGLGYRGTGQKRKGSKYRGGHAALKGVDELPGPLAQLRSGRRCGNSVAFSVKGVINDMHGFSDENKVHLQNNSSRHGVLLIWSGLP